MGALVWSDKYRDFMAHGGSSVEFLEGTTAAGKTTVGIVKFMAMASKSPKKLHIISGLDLGTIEKNIINKETGIVDVFGDYVRYNSAGRGLHTLPHIEFETHTGGKIIYVLGYDNKTRWKKALGGQYGCVYIDEINIADLEYVREVSMRCDYLMGTLNPDNPALPIYEEYINHARPLAKYANDAPGELLRMLDQPAKRGWVWWYFSFDHNASLTAEKRNQIIENVPKGTKLYKNKILGLRGKSTGLVFSNFDRKRHAIASSKVLREGESWRVFSAGLDTSYSSNSADTIAMAFVGITNKGRCITLDECSYNNKDRHIPIAPSDTVLRFVEFLDRNKSVWGLARNTFIDSADQATITEFAKHKRLHGSLYEFNPAYKKTLIIDRINLQLGWFAHDDFMVVDTCREYMSELDVYSWREDKDATPEDSNDHMINAVQYAWLPYKHLIGVKA